MIFYGLCSSTSSFCFSVLLCPLFPLFCTLGAHILSGNVFEPRALDELLPNWKQEEVCVFFPFKKKYVLESGL